MFDKSINKLVGIVGPLIFFSRYFSTREFSTTDSLYNCLGINIYSYLVMFLIRKQKIKFY